MGDGTDLCGTVSPNYSKVEPLSSYTYADRMDS